MAPIYLVSACSSGEEFVSAFRRYADRNGVLFVPISPPLPPGKKGRFALTLADGGVMVEGEAEVVSSAKTPSVLYGRVGMTLKFTEPDEPSKAILGDLEKARLTMKPSPPSTAPRPAEVPAEPRPTVPAPGGRVDAVNALAECVAIGDVAALAGGEPSRGLAGAPAPGAGKFAVPSIPPVSGARPKSPSTPTPPPLRVVPPPATGPLKAPTGPSPIVPAKTATPPAGTPALPPPAPIAKPPTGPSPIVPAKPMPTATPAAGSPSVGKETVMGMQAIERVPSGSIRLPDAAAPAPEPTPAPAPSPPTSPSGGFPVAKETVMGMPAIERAPSGPTRVPDATAAPAATTPAAATPAGPTAFTPVPTGTVVGTPPPTRAPTADVKAKTPPAGAPVVMQTPTVVGPPPARPATPPAGAPMVGKETVMGMQAIDRAPSAPHRALEDPTLPTPARAAAAAAATRDKQDLLQTVRGPAPAVDLTKRDKLDLDETMRGPAPPRPVGTPPPPLSDELVPVPQVDIAMPNVDDGDEVDDADEPTDLTTIPIEPNRERSVREPRRTVIGVAVVPSGVHVLPATPSGRIATPEESRDTAVVEAQDDPSGPAMITSKPPSDVDPVGETMPAAARLPTGITKAPTVEESTPSGDWTMTVGEAGPTITPTRRAATPAPGVPSKALPGPPTGDWMIALDPSQPDGWSEPSRIEKRPELPETPGPPVSTVSSEKDLDSEAKVPAPRVVDESKVEIDPTLMEPLQPLQPIDDFDDEPDQEPQLPPPPSAAYPVAVAPPGMDVMHVPQQMPIMPMPVSYGTQLPGQLPSASGQVPAYPMEMQPHLPTEAVRAPRPDAERKRRVLVIAVSAGVAIALVIVLAIVLGGGKKSSSTPAPGSASGASPPQQTAPPPQKAVVPTPPPQAPGDASARQAAVQPAVPTDAAVVEPPPVAPDAAVAVAVGGVCTVSVTSVPAGADIVLEKDVIGTTPATVKLPCGVESNLTFRKPRYVSAQRAVTPTAEVAKPVRVGLAKMTFTIKVSSIPPGATIMLGTKSLGVTPTAIKVPAFETSVLKIQKDGYAPDTQKVTPKANNASITSTLRRLPAKRLR